MEKIIAILVSELEFANENIERLVEKRNRMSFADFLRNYGNDMLVWDTKADILNTIICDLENGLEIENVVAYCQNLANNSNNWSSNVMSVAIEHNRRTAYIDVLSILKPYLD